MAFEIVDGMTGTKHISSDDLSALNIATVGKADCVLDYGDNFALTMVNSNTATLGTGVGMVGGKRFWNQAATSLTIQSGTQGQKRNDLVVARYAKTSAGIESITPVVIKGTPTTGTATDPDVTANDLKLWRIPLDGINAGTPVKLFDAVSPLSTIAAETKKLGDSVSLIDGWYVYGINGVKVAIKEVSATVSISWLYIDSIYGGDMESVKLPDGVFSAAPACSAAIAQASATCWIAPTTNSIPTKTDTQRFRVLSSSKETITLRAMITAVGV